MSSMRFPWLAFSRAEVAQSPESVTAPYLARFLGVKLLEATGARPR
jgi:hypothetical protein